MPNAQGYTWSLFLRVALELINDFLSRPKIKLLRLLNGSPSVHVPTDIKARKSWNAQEACQEVFNGPKDEQSSPGQLD